MKHDAQIISVETERSSLANALLPLPEGRITTRLATMSDVPFIDALQKKYSKQLGFFPRAQMEGYISNGWMRVAEENGRAIGYCASRDRYLKRDELGVVYQLCIDESAQRKLVGAMLLKSVFENSAYGTKLYCCWCAQDLAANKFWEAMGFVPIAFRTGSEAKARVHIFWQKRIRRGDESTPYWYPCQTNGGAIREDRIVLPIPPGTHWAEVMPVMLPGGEEDRAQKAEVRKIATTRAKATKPPVVQARQFGPPGAVAIVEPVMEETKKLPAPKKEARKHNPKLIAAARQLRDVWMERQEQQPLLAEGKYEVGRGRIEVKQIEGRKKRLLAA